MRVLYSDRANGTKLNVFHLRKQFCLLKPMQFLLKKRKHKTLMTTVEPHNQLETVFIST